MGHDRFTGARNLFALTKGKGIVYARKQRDWKPLWSSERYNF